MHSFSTAAVTMVLLTMTPSIVDALKLVDKQQIADESSGDASRDQPKDSTASSTEPAPGNPIAHSDIIRLYKKLNDASQDSAPKYSLEQLLQGSRVYIPPPPPKPEPVSPPNTHTCSCIKWHDGLLTTLLIDR